MKPTNVLIVYNAHNSLTDAVLKEILRFLKEKSVASVALSYHGEEMRPTVPDGPFDLAISLGGDGTFLYCAGLPCTQMTPILPINAGRLGFISEMSLEEWKPALERVFQGDCQISERINIEIVVQRHGHEVARLHGINEAVIHSGVMARIVRLDLNLDQTELGQIRGDGLIVATPMGSTAYSLAAGGPIIDPEMDALLLTPICPFSLSFRPLVFSGSSVLNVEISPDQRTNIHLTVDGQKIFPLETGDRISVRRSGYPIRVILSEKRNFYQVVRMKLGWLGGVDA